MARQKAPCGTDAAYRRHLRNKEPVDPACQKAHAEAGRGKRPTTSQDQSARSVANTPNPSELASESIDDEQLIIDTLRKAMLSVATTDPEKVAPIAREFRAALQASKPPSEQPKELSLADQLAAARAARAARAQSEGAAS